MIKDKQKLLDNSALKKYVEAQRNDGKKLVLTSGSWDILHVGHMRYLESAKELGDVLVVGIDSDKRIKKRKGDGRPIVPENERVEMLGHLKYVDAIYLKQLKSEPNELIKIVSPDILVVSKTTGHNDKKLGEKKELCGKVVVYERKAQTSTTARIRTLHVDGQKKLAEQLVEAIPKLIADLLGQKL